MHLGLIGGIGVAATLVYYRRLADRMAARGRPLELTVVNAEIDDLIRNNIADDRAAQAALYAPLVDRLRAAGADCAAIASVGGHFCHAETLARASLPMVSAIAPLDAHFRAGGVRRVGLLGTESAMRTRLYGQLATEAVVLEDALAEIGAAYMTLARTGRAGAPERATFLEAGRRLVEEREADAVLLAGTDLAAVFEGAEPGYRVVDAVDVHVDLLARLAADEITLAEAGAA